MSKYLVEFNGKIACVKEHCKDLGISYYAVIDRHRRTGESYPECLEYYKHHGVAHKLIDFNGKLALLTEHCEDLKINPSLVYTRHYRIGESYLKCLEYYHKNGVKHKNCAYKVKDKRLYSRWYNAKDRCENPKNPYYYRYGGRGIKVCERWQNYENFENDMLESFLDHVGKYGLHDTQIERNNYDGNYEPSNVTWATSKEQANNKSSNVMVTEDLTISQFAEKYNINVKTLMYRLNAGWSIEKIINTPASQSINASKYLLPCNISLKQHCSQNNYCYTAVFNYIKKYNLEPHEALAKYIEKNRNIKK